MSLRPLDQSACEAALLLDLGTGTGAALADQAQRFGVEPALGIDRDEAKVAKGQQAGRQVYAADLSSLDATAFPHVKIVTFELGSPDWTARVTPTGGTFPSFWRAREFPTAK